MTFEEVNDDYGLSKQPFRVVAALAVYGRLPLLEHTIRRLYEKNGCYKVVCAGDGVEEKKLCESLGAVWTPRRNKPLGMKWNSAFQKARDFNPDAIVFCGSSDWLSDNWFSIMRPHVERHDFVGVPGCDLIDIHNTIRGCHWAGYKGYRKERENESIGIGRMLSRRLLNAMDWTPFDPALDNSLDRSMKDRAFQFKQMKDFMVHDDRLKALSISTHLWPNKHKFEMHWAQMIPSKIMEDPAKWCEENFPEVLELQKTLYANTTGVRQ
jgi:hypothetical protein